MKCCSPITLRLNDSFKYETRFRYSEVFQTIQVGCGHCYACRVNKMRQWTMRLSHESLYYGFDNVRFITFTVSNSQIDFELRDIEQLKPLYHKFIDNLSVFYRRHYKTKLKYFTSFEYGERTQRPHFHMILFGVPNENRRTRKYYLNNTVANERKLTVHDKNIASKWKYGEIQFDSASNKAFQYVCSYTMKNAYSFLSFKEYHARYNKTKPFICMSKGIGERYAKDNALSLYKNLTINFQGRFNSIPKYYIKVAQKELDKIGQGYDLKSKLQEKYLIQRDKEIQAIYDKNKVVRRRTMLDFDNYKDYFNIENHSSILAIYRKMLAVKMLEYKIKEARYRELRAYYKSCDITSP